ncbi:hypothetical protein BDD12DRAFT_801773 [Trichophaea hybrida]|nr:hypothetical protein BDD12DRAFT_801773 [Trichophaea hybrida]
MRHSHRRTARTTPVTTTTRTKKPSLLSRLTRPRPATTTATTRRDHRNHHTTTPAPVTATHHHHQRRPSIGDRISGALLKLKGTVTGRSGQKAAGTRRMRGTDGRGSTTARRRYGR